MEERLTRTALKNDYMMLWSRNDTELLEISNLVMSLPRHILAVDSLPYVRYLSEKLALAFPSSHTEMLEVHSVWRDFIYRKGPRLAVKEKIRLIARLKRETESTEHKRCLRALSKFLRITEGEHSYMDAMLLYLSSVLYLEWRRRGERALRPESREKMAESVRDGLLESKAECSGIRKRSFAPALITEEYNSELLQRIKLKEDADAFIRRAETDLRKENEKRNAPPTIKERKTMVAIESGRARLSGLLPEKGKRLALSVSSLPETDADRYLRNLRCYMMGTISSTMPQIAAEAAKVISNREEYVQGRMTRTDLRRRNASFLRMISKRNVTEEIYASSALTEAVMDGNTALRNAIDIWLVPWLTGESGFPDEVIRLRDALETYVEDGCPI